MIKQLEPKHLGLSSRLLEFLAPEEEKRLTKLEAFRDLLEMATHFKGHVSCYGQEFDLVPGEVVTSISELAKKWRWQRATVRKFVDTLVDLGQITHTPQVKCSRMELITLRFKWLPSDHPINLLSNDGFPKGDVPLAEYGLLTTSIINELSEQFAKNASPMKDENGNILYTSEQRCQVATLYLEAMMIIVRHLMVSVYTPETEKSLLESFFKICHGSHEEAVRLMNALFEDEGHNINLMVWETYGDARDAVTRIFSQAFCELSERLPVDFTPTDSEDKPTKTDGVHNLGKRKDHTADNI
jgi:quinol monooxygenase YgiN